MRRRSRLALAVAVVAVAGVAILAIPATRTPVLRAAGWALVAEDPVEPADVIVVTADGDGAAVLEVADLVHRGISARVAVFADPPDSVDLEFIRRGLPYEDVAARSIQALHALGVAAAERIPRAVSGTGDEGVILPEWCDEQQLRSVLVVSPADHSRRLRRVLRRAMEGHRTKVAVRVTRYSDFDPDRWWQTRAGVRTGIVELQKLLLDLARHPLS